MCTREDLPAEQVVLLSQAGRLRLHAVAKGFPYLGRQHSRRCRGSPYARDRRCRLAEACRPEITCAPTYGDGFDPQLPTAGSGMNSRTS